MEISTAKEINSTEKLVEHVLEDDKRARNSDMWLAINIWRLQGIKVYVDYKQISNMIKPSTISRARRKIQNEKGKFIPTDPKVANLRGIREKDFREYYGRE